MSGFSLLEVLISLLLLACILLGFESGEIYSLRAMRDGYYFSIAVDQLQNMTQRLQMLKEYQGLAQLIVSWNEENKDLLPEGKGIVIGSYPQYRISLSWGSVDANCEQNQLGESGCLSRVVTI